LEVAVKKTGRGIQKALAIKIKKRMMSQFHSVLLACERLPLHCGFAIMIVVRIQVFGVVKSSTWGKYMFDVSIASGKSALQSRGNTLWYREKL
jgi:hypothetical protein